MQRCPTLVLLLALIGPPASAPSAATPDDSANSALLTRRHEALDRDLAVVRNLIARQLTPAQRGIYDQIRFVEQQSTSVLPYSRKAGEQREIAFSVGAHELFSQIVIGAMLEHALGLGGSTEKYAAYVAKQLHAARAGGSGRTSAPLAYHAYMKIPREQLDRIFDEAGMRRLTELVFVNLAFVIAHEVGHHVLGHFESTTTDPRKREDEADAFAAVVGAKAGLNPLLARAPFYFQSGMIEADQHLSAGYSSPACRIARFAAIGGRAAMDVGAFMKNLKDANQSEQFMRAVADAERHLREKC